MGRYSVGRRYRGRATTQGTYSVYVPGDPSPVDLTDHRAEDGHRVDTSARDEAPRGGGWMPLDAVQSPSAGLRSTGSPDEFPRTHDRIGGHRDHIEGGDSPRVSPILAFLKGFFPAQPNTDQTLDTAGSAGAAHGGIGERGMDPSVAMGRRCVDGQFRNPPTRLGHTYTIPIERVRRPLHFNEPRLRRVLQPSITTERGGRSPGGYSSQYDPTASAKTVGPRNPIVRRLIRPYGQAEVDTVSQEPGTAAASNPGPIGNGGW